MRMDDLLWLNESNNWKKASDDHSGCQSNPSGIWIYESQVKTLASILMEQIDGQEELSQLKLWEQTIAAYTTAQKLWNRD